LPSINLRVAPIRGGQSAEVVVAPWSADGAAITVPKLHIAERDGRVEMAGQVLVSGPVPGGSVRDLDLPIAGDWAGRAGWCWAGPARRCAMAGRAPVRWNWARSLDLCPVEGAPRHAGGRWQGDPLGREFAGRDAERDAVG
jgi:hypothetical protein